MSTNFFHSWSSYEHKSENRVLEMAFNLFRYPKSFHVNIRVIRSFNVCVSKYTLSYLRKRCQCCKRCPQGFPDFIPSNSPALWHIPPFDLLYHPSRFLSHLISWVPYQSFLLPSFNYLLTSEEANKRRKEKPLRLFLHCPPDINVQELATMGLHHIYTG